MPTGTQEYFKRTSGILYSYLISLPLLLLYELLIWISQPPHQTVRISVDVLFKSIFQFLGANAISTTLILAACIGAIIIYRKWKELPQLRYSYFMTMILESAIYAVMITILIVGFLDAILALNLNSGTQTLSKVQLFALSLGAGLYEELFFRVILVSGFSLLFSSFFAKKTTAQIISVLLAALIFSGVHYIGQYGDSFALGSFLFRFLFGLALNLIYVVRGFGIAAWTHALYDIFVISQM